MIMITPTLDQLTTRIEAAIEIATRYGQIDEAHHKAWVIDQMCRGLLGDVYEGWVATMKASGDDPDAYDYDHGIAP